MKGRKINLLVTGCGGDIGQSIGKILIENNLIDKLYGCDISENTAAKFIYSKLFVVMPCSDPDYISTLERIIDEYNINYLIPASEPELRFFSKKNIRQIGNGKLIMASNQALEIGFDKLLTSNFLQNENLPYPFTYSFNKIDSIDKFPVVVKSRTGSGSSEVAIVNDYETLKSHKRTASGFIVQEYLDGDNGEFTCGVFRSMDGEIRSIILKRELMGGFTGYAEVVAIEDITVLVQEIAEKLNLIGSINIQLRLTSRGPVVFEINPRFSSTVRFRDLLGFRDVQWSIEDVLGLAISDYSEASIGRKVYKGFNEYIQ